MRVLCSLSVCEGGDVESCGFEVSDDAGLEK